MSTIKSSPDDVRRELEALRRHVAALEAERDRAQAEYEDMKQRYEMLFAHAGESIFIIASDTKAILDANRNASRRLGYAHEALLRLRIDDIEVDAPSDISTAPVYWTSAFTGAFFYESLFRHKNGELIPVEISTRPSSYDGRAVLIVLARDIRVRRKMERAERDKRRLAEALRDSATALTSALDVDGVLDRILHNLDRVLEHDTADIMLLDMDRQQARIVRSRGYERWGLQDWIRDRRLALSGTTYALHEVLRTGEPLILPDVARYAGWAYVQEMPWVRSYACAPICHEGRMIGLLNLNSTISGFYQPAHAHHLQVFADQAAIALHNAELYRELARRAEALEQALAERDYTIEDLDAFSHTVAHDLKNPLTLMQGYADLLTTAPELQEMPDMLESAQMILQGSRKMRGIVDELLLLAHVRREPDIQRSVLAMGAIITGALQRLELLCEQYGATVIAPDTTHWPLAWGYGPWVEEVWANYISNAIKYGGSPPKVWLGAAVMTPEGAAQRMARFWVRDNGPGIPPHAQDLLFRQFKRFTEARAEGHGLGLSIVQRVISKLGGEVGMEGEPGQGCTFYFTLPVAQDADQDS